MQTLSTQKYQAFPPVDLQDRQWPNAVIRQPPVWMSTDLRDGNQSLFEPMDAAKKLRMFNMLCKIGFKEIEVAFPSASDTDFNFVRSLIEENHIPQDVTIEVLTQAREPLIRRTMASVRGARRVIVHIYNALSPTFREVVFNMSQAEVKAMAVEAVLLVKSLAADMPDTEVLLEYSPETFTATELAFSKEVCDAVTAAWEASPERQVIINCPATVEVASPNVYADQIEWMHRNLARRDSVILSLHPHNDRGTAVAATELGIMAGADRVEGCLFGHGERTGNVDLVTVALNMFTQGVDTGLDFSDIDTIARTVEACTQIDVHPRHPYAGDLVFTAFSGSHQDAIKKGFASQSATGRWNVPYLPIDPKDLGRNYDSIIRVNSQSGKGGVAYLMEHHYSVVMPRRMQVEFSAVVQQYTDAHGSEVGPAALWQLFHTHYVDAVAPMTLKDYQLETHAQGQAIRMHISVDGVPTVIRGQGNGPVDAAIHALQNIGMQVQVRSFEERSLGASASAAEAMACAIVEVVCQGRVSYGVGMDTNIVTASIKAIVSGMNRCAAAPAAMVKSA
ncbi:2-isopropylmalate synthase [Methylophilus medardicus]|uniref:2-isopropylmalate synthase n=1 Tax=Methylophilus medardicus TaxID=2588534 RepID=A0A5B8CTH3_9PROT|nr:2-isopropylmalate synthase [Methylophilus medardicus]QDC44400.1 2-isopropylmalate synthase [Methylophilus medardicus]QDC49407.1 2-isopropylmalate synthase [Methylophilus medardicus]QDC53112.1 2-isopropylmalate synthase [Methylophilus medardicus]